ncbi:uncharacterized protein LOC123718200, partial [Pieris brassicae]|uniref:uncharacterized protein LOC123718200 n=1 Tax=Pieris brassicae TaxID=7116 RepID=UPI001E65E695
LPPLALITASNRFLIAIYDKKFKECSDSKLKIKAWNDISGIIFSTVWGTLSSQERNKAGKLVQKRWKNLRACFLRELREQKCTKSDQAATKRRKYKHFDQLLFLIPSLDTRETSGNADSVEEINCEEDSQDASREVRQREEYFRKKNKNKICYEERLLEILNNKRVDDNKFIEAMRNNKSDCNDDDKERHFALSLGPLLKAVPEENQLDVQIKILQIFQEVQKQNTQRNNYSPMNSPSTIYRGSPQNFLIKPKYSVSLPSQSPQDPLHLARNTPLILSPCSTYIPSKNPRNMQIKPKYSISLSSHILQNSLHLARNTPLILSPSTYIPSKNPRNMQIKPKYSISLSSHILQNSLHLARNTPLILSPSTYIPSKNPRNMQIKPKYSISLSSHILQNSLHLARNTQLISSPSTYIPSKNPRNMQIKPKYSVSLPPTAQSAKPTPLSKKHATDFISLFNIYSI